MHSRTRTSGLDFRSCNGLILIHDHASLDSCFHNDMYILARHIALWTYSNSIQRIWFHRILSRLSILADTLVRMGPWKWASPGASRSRTDWDTRESRGLGHWGARAERTKFGPGTVAMPQRLPSILRVCQLPIPPSRSKVLYTTSIYSSCIRKDTRHIIALKVCIYSELKLGRISKGSSWSYCLGRRPLAFCEPHKLLEFQQRDIHASYNWLWMTL